jgi:hypothetical protein
MKVKTALVVTVASAVLMGSLFSAAPVCPGIPDVRIGH